MCQSHAVRLYIAKIKKLPIIIRTANDVLKIPEYTNRFSRTYGLHRCKEDDFRGAQALFAEHGAIACCELVEFLKTPMSNLRARSTHLLQNASNWLCVNRYDP